MKVISNLPAHIVSACCFHCAFCFYKPNHNPNLSDTNNINLFDLGSSWSGRLHRYIRTNGIRLDCRARGWRCKPSQCSLPHSVYQETPVFAAFPLRFRAPYHPHPPDESSSSLTTPPLRHLAQHPPAHGEDTASTQESGFLTRRVHSLNARSSRIKCIFVCCTECQENVVDLSEPAM